MLHYNSGRSEHRPPPPGYDQRLWALALQPTRHGETVTGVRSGARQMGRASRFPWLPVVLSAVVVLVFGCGSGAESAGPTVTVGPGSTTSALGSTTSSGSISTIATPSSPGDDAPTSTSIRGEPFERGPMPGARLGVMGVAYNDVLHLRRLPGPTQAVVADLEPTTDGLVATGQAWIVVGSAIWYEVTVNGVTGWAKARYLMYPGTTDDLTAAVIAALGSTPKAETMVDLGALVATTLAGDPDPDGGAEIPRITLTVAPTFGDLEEITYDVVGQPDDSVAGFRVHVFGTPSDSGEGFILRSAEATIFCWRGVTGELCV
jgi:hypothetical protein